MVSKILIVFTSADKGLTGGPSGWYLPEAAHPYYVLAPHFDIDFASPKGANPPVDPVSVANYKDDGSVKFLVDEVVQQKLATCKKLSDVKASDYVAIFYVGGQGPCIDLAFDPVSTELANEFWRTGKIVSAVCHGPGALIGCTDASGQSIFKGRRATCFTVAEEKQLGTQDNIPFQPEEKLKDLGAAFEIADELFGVKAVVDGKLLTGQNPASALALGEEVLKALKG